MTLEKNLELLSRFTPALVPHLMAADPVPLDEGALLLPDLEGVEILYFHGLSFDLLKHVPSGYVVFCESDLGKIRTFVEDPRATPILRNKRVRVKFLPPGDSTLLELICDYFALLNGACGTIEGKEGFDSFSQQINRASIRATALALHTLNRNESLYKPLYNNLSQIEYDGSRLRGAFEGIPAIICGAGPSLEKELPLLKTLEDRALIFGAGSGLTALTNGGVTPHFGGGLCPGGDEVNRFRRQSGHMVPLFFKTRLHPEALQLIQGPKIYCSPDPRPAIMEWLEGQMGIQGEMRISGELISSAMIDLVSKLGCNPILFCGLDLALTGGQLYSEGVSEERSTDEERILTSDIYGKPIQTYYRWLDERDQLSTLIAERSKTQWINCTEGGIGIPGVENRSLEEAVKEFSRADYRGLVHSKVMPTMIKPNLEPIVDQLKGSIERVIEIVGQLSAELARIADQLQKRIETAIEELRGGKMIEEMPFALTSGKAALYQHDLEEELAYQLIFDEMLLERDRQHRRIHEEFLLGAGRQQLFCHQRRLNIEQERYIYLQQAATENLEILCRAFS